MADVSRLNVQIDGDESGLVAAANRSEAALNDLGNAASRSGGRITAAGQQAKTYGTMARGAAGNTANLAAQFNDIGLMLASGQSPLMLAMQQGTQVNQVLGQMGTNGVSRVQALKTAFLSVVQPANLVTFGIIAGGAALIQFGFKAIQAANNTRNLEDALEDLEDIAGRVNHAANILSKSAEDLREEYGDLADEVRALARAELDLARVEQTISFQGRIGELRSLAGEYSNVTWNIEQTIAAMGLEQAARSIPALVRLQRDLNVTAEQAVELEQAFDSLRTATNMDEQIAAFNGITAALEAAGVEMTQWPDELRAAAETMNQLQFLTVEIEANTRRAVGNTAAIGDAAESSADAVKALSEAWGGQLGRLNDPKAPNSLDMYQSRLESLQEALMTEEEAEMASFQRRQELLEYALEKQLLTQEQYQNMMRQVSEQHADSMERIEAKQHDAIAAQARGSFNELANALRQHNDDLFRIAKIAGAAEALINAWRAYAQTLADPSLPFFAKFAAAASVLAAGLNAVSAIKGASSGGGAHGGYSGGGRNAGGANNLQVGGEVSRNVTVALEGEMFSRDMVKTFINKINEAVEDGAQIRVV